jgi:glycosyltransferase involved in cell wall biosynthesis
MKIGMLVNNLEVSGGYQKLVIRLSQQLQEMGHEVYIYTPKLDTKACYPNDIKKLNVSTIPKEFSDQTPVVAYEKLVAGIDPKIDAFIIHDELSLIGIALLPNAPKKVIWMLNNQLPENLVKYRPEVSSVYRQVVGKTSTKLRESKKAVRRVKLIRLGLKRTHLLVTYDSFNQELVNNVLRRRAEVVFAGADLEQFKKYAKDRKFNKKSSYQILSVGVVFPHRRYEDLLEAVAILAKEEMPVKATIVGRQDLSAEYFSQLQKLVAKHKIGNRIVFKNYVSDSEMVNLYKDSDVFVFINDGFTWGIAAFEAVAARLPVIITSNIGAADLIHDGQTGWVVPPRNPTAVAESIKSIINDRQKAEAVADKAQQEVASVVSWQAYAIRIEKLLKSDVQYQ